MKFSIFLCAYITVITFISLGIHQAEFGQKQDCKGFMSCGGIPQKTIVTNTEILWTAEMQKQWEFDEEQIRKLKNKALEASKAKKAVLSTSQVKKPQESGKEVKQFDLDRLSWAVAMHETGNCTKKTGASLVNNCHGIMTWDKYGHRSYKKYKSKEESHADFKRIWSKYYGELPTLSMAIKYSGNDRPKVWLSNVLYFYGSKS